MKVKQAIAIGCHLSIGNDKRYRLFWPAHSVEIFGATADAVLDEMKAIQASYNGWPEEEETKDVIPKDGGIAYHLGVPAADCPYPENSEDSNRWYDEWDAAADEEEEGGKPAVPGSVVTNRYRSQYSEYGHPTHCGDELAILLNNLCLNKAGINLELFEAICAANGVNLAKYNRTTKGWQGRLRMTGRNLLAKRVRENGGKLLMPDDLGEYQLSQDWIIQAELKYKPKTE